MVKSSILCSNCKERFSAETTNSSSQSLQCLFTRTPFSLRLMLVTMVFHQLKRMIPNNHSVVRAEHPPPKLQKINIKVT